jgi:hypothetical protein
MEHFAVSGKVIESYNEGPHRPNENKISDGYRGASANRSGSVLIIGKRGRAAGSRSLHRMVRRFIHLLQLIIWMLWGLMEAEV